MADFGARFAVGGDRHNDSCWVVPFYCRPAVPPIAESIGVCGCIVVTLFGCPYCWWSPSCHIDDSSLCHSFGSPRPNCSPHPEGSRLLAYSCHFDYSRFHVGNLRRDDSRCRDGNGRPSRGT